MKHTLITGWLIVSCAGAIVLYFDNRFTKLEKRYIDRFEPLIKDSLKMHQWYHNWEANYDEKRRVYEGNYLKIEE